MSAEIQPSASINSLYENDFYAWTQEQSKLLRAGAWKQLDILNLAEEIESLGKQHRQELVNRLGVLLGHLLKWEFQPEQRCKSWFATIREQRRRISRLLQQNPSLKPYQFNALTEAYPDSVDLVIRETPLRYRDLPQDCPYSLEQVLNSAFFPGQPTELTDWEWAYFESNDSSSEETTYMAASMTASYMTARPIPSRDLYETDFYAWTQEQSKLLRAGDREQLN